MKKNHLVAQAVALALATGTAPVGNAQQSGATELEEVVVTATRRAESLQNTSVSVQAFDSASLDTLNVGSLEDYLRYTPALKAAGAAPGTTALEMRGVAAAGSNVFQAGTIGGKASVAQYLDETSVSAGGSGTRNSDFYITDVNRIEVLRGPQGTLFGSASLSGAIRVITNKPDPEQFNARVELTTGQTSGSSDLNRGIEAMLNVPLFENRAAIRIAAYNSFSAGYLDNTPATTTLAVNNAVVGNPRFANTSFGALSNASFAKEKDLNTVEYTGARVSGSFQLNENWKLSAQYTQQKLATEGPFDYRADIGDLKVVRYGPEFLDDDVDLAAWTVEGRIAALDVIYAGSYMERHIDQLGDYSQYTETGYFLPYYICNFPSYTSCAPPRQEWTAKSDLQNVSHELRIASDPSKRLSFVAGGYYNKNGCKDDCGTSIEFLYYGGIAQGFPRNAPHSRAISYDPSPRAPGVMFFTDMIPIVEEKSFFGELTFKMSDQWTATLGARHYDIGQQATGSVNFASRSPSDAGVNFSDNLRPVSESDTVTKFNLTYTPSDNLRLYATYSEGFSIGGYNRTGGRPGFNGFVVPVSYDTETTKNYEFGWKATFADRRARFNGAIYKIAWDGIVVGIFNPAITNALFFANAGNARIKGFEGDFAYLLNDKWSFEGSVSITDTKLTNIPSTVPDIVGVGAPLPRQPKFAANARIRKTFNWLGADSYAMLAAVYSGSRYTSVQPSRSLMPSYATFDFNLGMTFNEKIGVRMNIENLTDKRYELDRDQTSGLGYRYLSVGRPRTIGLTVTYNFR